MVAGLLDRGPYSLQMSSVNRLMELLAPERELSYRTKSGHRADRTYLCDSHEVMGRKVGGGITRFEGLIPLCI